MNREKREILGESALDSLWWNGLISGAGLLQVWLIFFVVGFLQNGEVKATYLRILKEGSILFFLSALVASVAIDYHFSSVSFKSRKNTERFFLLIPVVIILFCAITSLILLLQETQKTIVINYNNFIVTEYSLIVCSFVYSYSAKLIYFYQEKQK